MKQLQVYCSFEFYNLECIQDFINTKCYDAYYYKDELVVKEPSETLDSLYRY